MNLNLKIKLLIAISFIVVTFTISYLYFSRDVVNNGSREYEKTFTTEQLSIYNGSDSSLPIYIGLNGYVYDVTSGTRFYNKGKAYNYLTGKDSSTELNLIGGSIIEKKYPIVGKLIQ